MSETRKRNEAITNNIESFAEKIYQKLQYCPIKVDNRTAQLHGVDWVDARSGIRVDDKAAISAWNRPLESFGFELECRGNKNCEGWFARSDSWTTHYGLIIPRADDEELTQLKQLEVIVISKKAIWRFLRLHGVLDVQDALDMVDRYAALKGDRYILDVPGCGFLMKNWRLWEEPINIHIKMKYLRNIADKVYLWTPAKDIPHATVECMAGA